MDNDLYLLKRWFELEDYYYSSIALSFSWMGGSGMAHYDDVVVKR